jgi:ligand-binding sensor domain-containing protein
MLRRKILRFAVALTLGLSFSAHAQFDHLSLEHGLSQTTVVCIRQDRQGYLWFGTADGLNKYDGYSVAVYRNNPRNPHSLSDDWVTAICEDPVSPNALWIGTAKGVLNKFDRKSGRFTRYNFTPAVGGTKDLADLPFTFSFFNALWACRRVL